MGERRTNVPVESGRKAIYDRPLLSWIKDDEVRIDITVSCPGSGDGGGCCFSEKAF